jgi:hypothetical protein
MPCGRPYCGHGSWLTVRACSLNTAEPNRRYIGPDSCERGIPWAPPLARRSCRCIPFGELLGNLTPSEARGPPLIAAEKSGRVARLMELDPRDVDVIVRRGQEWTGKAAVREADGVGFDDVAAGSDVSPTQLEQPTSELYRFTVMG